jgi:putative ABC transport system permease protein
VRLVLGSSVRLIVTGAAIGGAAALVAGRWAGSLLFGVEFFDPWVYAIVVGAVLGTGLLAAWQPARRAGRVDPLVALRAE